MRGCPLLSSVPLQRWIMMCTDRDKELASDLYGQLQKICTGMGMAIEKPQL